MRRKNSIFSFLYNPKFISLVGLAILILILIPLIDNYQQRLSVDQEIEDIKKEIEYYESKNQDLSQKLEFLASDQAVEEQAKLNLGLKNPGEQVVVIRQEDLINDEAEEENMAKEEFSNFKKWINYFFNNKR